MKDKDPLAGKAPFIAKDSVSAKNPPSATTLNSALYGVCPNSATTTCENMREHGVLFRLLSAMSRVRRNL
jgi:hypothetical protein